MKRLFPLFLVLLISGVAFGGIPPSPPAKTVTVSDTAYDATTWDANTDAATKNAIRDKIQAITATAVLGATYTAPVAADDGKYLLYTHAGTTIGWGAPAGGGDMLIAVWAAGADGFIDQDAGGTNIDTSASTGVPSISGGTWSVAATLTHELGGLEADIHAYTGLVGMAAEAAVEVDTEAEFETAMGGATNFIVATEINTFSKLDTLVADKGLINLADAATIAGNWVNTANPWDVNEGGTGAATFTDGGIMIGNGTGALEVLGVAANGQIPIGDGTTSPVLAGITGTASEVTVTDGPGTITISLPNHAGTDISADLEEEVTEGSLANDTIVSDDIKDDTITAANLAAIITFSDGDLVDMSGITHTGAADEGLVLPTWADVVPTSDKKFLAVDGSNLKLYNGAWVTIGATAAPTDAKYLVGQAGDAVLSAEQVLTDGYGLDTTLDTGPNPDTLTIAIDTTEISADGSDTWSDNSKAEIAWTFDVSGTDHTMTAGDGLMTFGDAVTVTDTLTATNGDRKSVV